MTDYEIAVYATSVMGNFLSAVTVYFSIITAYVIAAFVAGTRLSKVQLLIVNASFTIAAAIMGTLSVLVFNRFYALAQKAQALVDAALVDFSVPLGGLIIILYLGSLIFMWNVREKSADA